MSYFRVLNTSRVFSIGRPLKLSGQLEWTDVLGAASEDGEGFFCQTSDEVCFEWNVSGCHLCRNLYRTPHQSLIITVIPWQLKNGA